MDIFIYVAVIVLLSWLFRFFWKSPYEKIFTCSLDGISIIKNNKIVDCNKSLLDLFGYEKKQKFLHIHPLKLSPAYQPDGEFSLTKADRMFAHSKEFGNVTFDWVFVDITNQEKWIEISILKTTHMGSEIFFMIWKNINQRKHIEHEMAILNANLENMVEKKTAELLEKEHMLFIQSKQAQMGEMISMIAHQWRQPLASISASVIELRMKMFFKKNDENKQFDDQFVDYIDGQLVDIENYTQSLTHTIDDFRNFYKPQTAKVHTLIDAPITKAFNIVKGSLSSAGISVDMEFNATNEIDCFEGEMIHIFLNLFSNAHEHFEQLKIADRKIKIKTTNLQNGVEVLFCDNGGGIPEDVLDKVFSAYFTTKGSGTGTGLGLYMSKKILNEHHNSDINVSNDKDGACFRLDIKSV